MIEKLLESIIKRDKSTWDKYKKTRKEKVIIHKEDFERIKESIADYNFEFVVFKGCAFRAEFINCRFFGASFKDCLLDIGARFTLSDFRSSVFTNTTFQNVNLMKVNLNNCKFDNCTFNNVDCKFSSIVKSFFKECTIKGLEL